MILNLMVVQLFLLWIGLAVLSETNIIHEEISKRLFVKLLETITLDVFINDDYILYLEELKANTKYVVTLSYPGVYPVQYTVFLEREDEEESYPSYDYKRRIQDTRLFSFETDSYGSIVSEDENGNLIRYEPILHIQPHHVIDVQSPDDFSNRYVAIVIEPLLLGTTPTIRSEILFILVVLFIVLFGVTCYYQNESFRGVIQRFLGIQQKED